MRLHPVVYGFVVVALFLGTIIASQTAGVWSVSGKMNSNGERVSPTGANVDEIKGWMTIGEVAEAYNVPIDEILSAFNLAPATPPKTLIKNLESDLFSTANLRAWLADRISAPAP